MKGSLFEKKNPLALARKKKNIPTCTNCPGNKRKKENFKHAKILQTADVLFVLPSTKFNAIRRKINIWQKKQTLIEKISYLPDILCKHPFTEKENKYATRNLHCNYLIQEYIKESNIKHVFLVGIGAVRSYFGEQYSKDLAYHKVRGFTMPDLVNDVMVSFVYEPSMDALLGEGRDTEVLERTIFKQDLQKGMRRYMETILPEWKNPQELCRAVEEDKAIEYMDDILRGVYKHFISFDYETTGLKPFRKGQKVVSCGIAVSSQFAFAFVLTDRANDKLRQVLASRKIPKIAANNPFEYKWTKYHLKHSLNNIIYDCCLGAHIMDLRGGVVSVKFQARMRYGIMDYEKSMKKFLVPSEKEIETYGANAINTVMSAPQKSLLLYNALDALLEYWIARDSMDELGMEYRNDN